MATLPPDPYAPDPVINPDGSVMPATSQPEVLPGPENPEPPKLSPDDIDNVPVNRPVAS